MLQDLQCMRRKPNQETPLLSQAFITAVCNIFRWEMPLFIAFRKDRNISFIEGRISTILRFCQGEGGFKAINRLLDCTLAQAPKQPNRFTHSLVYLNTAAMCLNLCRRIKESEIELDEPIGDAFYAELQQDIRAIFLTFQRGLKGLIEKHHSILSTREINWALDVMSSIAVEIGLYDFHGAVAGLGIDNPPLELTPREAPLFVDWCWKVRICLALIYSVKMDLRLLGIQKLGDSILRIWTDMTSVGLRDGSLLRFVPITKVQVHLLIIF